jgi:hypothetical protein
MEHGERAREKMKRIENLNGHFGTLALCHYDTLSLNIKSFIKNGRYSLGVNGHFLFI